MTPKFQLKRRLRGEILRLLYENHEKQQSRLDDVTLTGVLERLRFDVYVNLIRELLQDLNEREMIWFNEDRDRTRGEVRISQIMIRPKGRSIIEGDVTDPAIDVG
jgi:hypothetical protein